MEPIYSVEEGLRALDKYLKEHQKQGLLSKKTYEELLKRIKEDTDAVNKNTQALDTATSKVKKVAKVAGQFAASTVRASESIRKNREDFTSLNPAVKVAAKAAEMAGSATGKLISSIGDAVNAFSIFGGPLTKIIGTVAGTGMSMLGDFMDKNAKQVAALGSAFGTFALQELQNVVESYRTIGSVGGTTARGMSGVYDDAIRAGMSVKEYSQLISSQGENLAGFAGSVTAGAESLGKVSQANEGYKKEYLALGYTYAEQQQYTADYLQRNRVISGTSINDTNALAEGSRAYMDLLDDISRLTGKSRSEAAKALEKQESNLRFQASMRLATQQSGNEKIANNMRLMAEGIEAFGSEGLSQGFMDMMGGLGTKAAKTFNLATNGEGQKIAEMVKRGEIDAARGLEMVQAAVDKRYAGIGGDNFAMKVSKTGTAMEDALPGMQRMTYGHKMTVENLEKIQKEREDTKQAKDQETKNILGAQESLRQMGIEMDKIVKDKVFPLATTAVDKLTDVFVSFVDKASDTLGLTKVTRPQKHQTLMEEAAEAPGAFTEDEDTKKTVKPGEGLSGKPLTGVQPTLAGRIEQVAREYKTKTGKDVNVTSAIRPPEQQAKLYEDYLAGKSKYPVAPPGRSKHDRGLAIDVDSQVANQLDSMGLLAKYGLGRPVARDPVHIEVVSLAQGGVVSGPESGYPAILHGTEAVIPLFDNVSKKLFTKDNSTIDYNSLFGSFLDINESIAQLTSGLMSSVSSASGPKNSYTPVLSNTDATVPLPSGDNIPVETTKMTESTEKQIKTLRRQNQIISDLIAAARSNNDANKRIISLKAS